MREIGVKELKASLSETLRAAEQGEQIRVTKHGRAIVDIVPSSSPEKHLERLIAEGRITPAREKPSSDLPPLAKSDRLASEEILAEREAER